jgi:hypothetical protein
MDLHVRLAKVEDEEGYSPSATPAATRRESTKGPVVRLYACFHDEIWQKDGRWGCRKARDSPFSALWACLWTKGIGSSRAGHASHALHVCSFRDQGRFIWVRVDEREGFGYF